MSTTLTRRSATSAHEAVAHMVRDTLRLAPEDALRAFWGLAIVLRAKLTPEERQGLHWATSMACDDEEVAGIAQAILGPFPGAGWPDVPFLLEPEVLIGDAALWAECAHPDELRAYAVAILAKLPKAERDTLLRLLDGEGDA